jgi:hypothetical protein
MQRRGPDLVGFVQSAKIVGGRGRRDMGGPRDQAPMAFCPESPALMRIWRAFIVPAQESRYRGRRREAAG